MFRYFYLGFCVSPQYCSTKENTDRTRPRHRAPGWSSVFESKQKPIPYIIIVIVVIIIIFAEIFD